MALRLRRGTDAERLTITPVEGELIYTTDLQELWIGDGTTIGGNKIGGIIPQFLDDLSNVDAASPQIGQVLKWDGNNWVASDDSDTGIIEGLTYRINIVDDSSTIMLDTLTSTFTGNFIGDGSGLTNLPVATDGSGIVEGSNYRINIVDDSSTVMLNTSTSTFTGNFVGDGSGLTNLPEGIEEGSSYRINIISDDNTIIVDGTTNTFQGTFDGSFVGDGSGLTNLPIAADGSGIVEGSNYRINIIGDDSSIIIDTSNLSGTFTEINISEISSLNSIIVNSSRLDPPISINLQSTTPSGSSVFTGIPHTLELKSSNIISDLPNDINSGDILGGISLAAVQSNLSESYNFLVWQADPNHLTTEFYVPSKLLLATAGPTAGSFGFTVIDSEGNFGIGIENPECKLDVNGLMKLEIQTVDPSNPKEGMISIASGNASEFDPKGTDLGKSYPCYYDGENWIPMI